MIRKSHILSFILMLGFTLSLTNGFADEVPELIFEVRIPESDAYIQGNEDFKRGPNSIFGTPDFEKMRDLPENSRDYQLGRKVAFIFTPVAPGASRGFICTGFLVGPDLLLTNHHCVHDDFGRPYPLELIQIYMDYYQEPDVDRTRGGVTAGVTAVLQADAPKDYALLRLDKPIGNTYGWLELDTTITRPDSSQSVKLMSHNRGRSKEIVRRNSQIVDIPANHPLTNVPFALAYLADTEGGSSGSPIFLRDGTSVIGINHSSWSYRGEPTFNAGSLMSYIVPEIQEYLPGGAAPDLAVGSPRISNPFSRPGESFTFSATVRNQGTVAAPATTLRFYRSSDSTITPSDVVVGSTSVRALAPNATTELDVTLTAPTSEGTYYYGGCVDAVGNEGRTDNNCSTAVEIKVSTTPPFWIYWRSYQGIQRATNDGTNRQLLVNTQTGSSGGIALDVEGGKMYWTLFAGTGRSKIQRANLDGSNVEDLITGLNEPDTIALDVANRKVYWTNTFNSNIHRANLDGSNVEAIVVGRANLRGLTLDVANRKVYWTDRGYGARGARVGKIHRANLDGSNVEDVITGLPEPGAIALDVANRKVYWTNSFTTQIQRANLDGSNIEDLVGGLRPAYIALDVEGGKMYWTDIGTGQILRANLNGSNIEDLVTTVNNPPFAIALGISQSTAPPPIAPPDPAPLDVNRDGQVTVMDLVAVALFYGTRVPGGISLPADVNADGVVNVLDLTAVAQGIDAAQSGIHGFSLETVEAALLAAIEQTADIEAIAEAPIGASTPQHVLPEGVYNNVADALADARHFATGDMRTVLEGLLELLSEIIAIPETTALLPNYPNPFNPETWIPYQLSKPTDVTVSIYAGNGTLVRTLALGHQPAGMYQSRSRAAYWDGKNALGEPVASGVYFYTLTAGDFSATRKMLIRK